VKDKEKTYNCEEFYGKIMTHEDMLALSVSTLLPLVLNNVIQFWGQNALTRAISRGVLYLYKRLQSSQLQNYICSFHQNIKINIFEVFLL
jgi:hypothetical protein